MQKFDYFDTNVPRDSKISRRKRRCERCKYKLKCKKYQKLVGSNEPVNENPTGYTRVTTQLQGLQLQLRKPAINTIEPGDNVPFDTIITAQSPSISVNDAGIITISTSGLFYINWWVVTDGMQGGTDLSPMFAVVKSSGDKDRALSTTITGQVNGNALIPITASSEMPVTLRLINSTDSTIAFSETPIKADITIINVTLMPQYNNF